MQPFGDNVSISEAKLTEYTLSPREHLREAVKAGSLPNSS
jgi:hypothetical protein